MASNVSSVLYLFSTVFSYDSYVLLSLCLAALDGVGGYIRASKWLSS